MTRVLMVYPRFNPNSFWDYSKTCETVGAKRPAPPLGLMTVAAMLPPSWDVQLVDCNADPLTDGDIARADLVMMGSMFPQQHHALSLIGRFHALGKLVVVGGPDVTSSPDMYAAADFRVIGEAEGIFHEFLAAWERGERSGTFTAEKFKADVTTSPVPRFDLIRTRDYTHLSVQFSRGCPFTCEFCDIIELYGRVPRTKTAPQVLAELDALLATGYRGHVDFVDDNLIGNKKALRAFLPHLIDWQKRNGYPFEFSTEASINLADDPEVLASLREANFFLVFVGIESPDPETLRLMQKKQNTRRSIPESIAALHRAGLMVVGGFIVGFDSETEGVSEGIVTLIEESNIPVATVGLLFALPNTQLTRRLEREGRLHPGKGLDLKGELGDQCTAGLNFDTLRPRGDVLADYHAVIERVYTPAAFFGRMRRVGLALDIRGPGARLDWRILLRRDLWRFLRLLGAFLRGPADVRREFLRTVATVARRNPAALKVVFSVAALYLHLGPFSRYVLGSIGEQIAEVRSGRWRPLLSDGPSDESLADDALTDDPLADVPLAARSGALVPGTLAPAVPAE